MSKTCTIQECGNGFPDVGDYVPGDDGELYQVARINSRIQTGSRSGAPNYIYAEVQLARWSDCDESDEFPALAVLDEPADDLAPESDDDDAARADHEHDQAKDDRLTGDR